MKELLKLKHIPKNIIAALHEVPELFRSQAADISKTYMNSDNAGKDNRVSEIVLTGFEDYHMKADLIAGWLLRHFPKNETKK